MDCNHDTRLDCSIFVQCICHRSKAVCCTRSCRDDCIICFQCLVVCVIYDSRKVISCWSRDNNFSSTCIDMSLCFFFGCIESGALQNYVYTKLTPWAVVCIRESIDFNLFTIYCDGIITCRNSICFLIFTLRRIILQKVCKHLRACQIVNCYYFITFCTKHLSECKTSDTSKSVNRYFY